MDRSELLTEISAPLFKSRVEELSGFCSEKGFSVADLLDLSFYPKAEVAFRAAWILEYVQQSDPERFLPVMAQFLDRYPKQQNQSCRRHFTKIMMWLTGPEHLQHAKIPQGYDLEPMVEKTFEWLIDRKTPVAVKVNCLDILFNLKPKFPWIEEELRAQVAFLLHDGSAAMQSRGKAILRKLKR